MKLQRTVCEDSWLRLLYVTDGLGRRHYATISTLFRAGDEVEINRAVLADGLALVGYGMREVWRPLPAEQEEAA